MNASTIGHRLRVMTFNVHHGASHRGLARLTRTIEAIGDVRPDVLGVQEVEWGVPRSWWFDQPRRVARADGYAYEFTPAHRYGPRGVFGYAGNAVMSRYPLRNVYAARLPAHGEEHRFATLARTGPDDALVTVLNTHLVNDDVVGATVQLDALLGALSRWPQPWIVMGDFNLTAREIRPMVANVGLELVDAGPTSPAAQPQRTLDWIAYAGVDLVDAFVPETTVSDHRPVVAIFEHRR